MNQISIFGNPKTIAFGVRGASHKLLMSGLVQRIDFEASHEVCGKTHAVPNPVKANLEVILLLRGEAKAVSIVDVEAAVGLGDANSC